MVADADHDVVVFPESDLAVRFNKKATPDIPVTLFLHEEGQAYFRGNLLRSFMIYEDFSGVSGKDSMVATWIIVECSENKNVPESIPPKELFSKALLEKVVDVEESHAEPEELCRRVGLDPASCQQITDIRKFRMEGKKTGTKYDIFFWRTTKYAYFFTRRDAQNKLQVQMQINSLAPSVSSINLDDPAHRTYNE